MSPLPLPLQVYLDIGIAPTALKPSAERTLGSKSSIPIEAAAPAGRIVIGMGDTGGYVCSVLHYSLEVHCHPSLMHSLLYGVQPVLCFLRITRACGLTLVLTLTSCRTVREAGAHDRDRAVLLVLGLTCSALACPAGLYGKQVPTTVANFLELVGLTCTLQSY